MWLITGMEDIATGGRKVINLRWYNAFCKYGKVMKIFLKTIEIISI